MYHVSPKVNKEDGDGTKRKRDAKQDEEQEGSDFRDVGGQCVGNGFLQVVKNETTYSKWEGEGEGQKWRARERKKKGRRRLDKGEAEREGGRKWRLDGRGRKSRGRKWKGEEEG